MQKIIACSYVFGKYHSYIPLYVFSMLRAYPGYFVRIYSRDPVPATIRHALKTIKSSLSDRFEVIEGSPIAVPPMTTRNVETFHAVRFLMGKEHFAGFRYGYTADIDVIIVKEEPGLLEQEIARAKQLNLPYSNVVRATPGNTNRMAGWHFFEVDPYFRKTQPLIEFVRTDPNLLDPGNLPCCGHDERLLYRLVKHSHGLLEADDPRPFEYTLEHGFHLGMHRVGVGYPTWWRKNDAWREDGLVIFADERFMSLRRWLRPEVVTQLNDLELFLRSKSSK